MKEWLLNMGLIKLLKMTKNILWHFPLDRSLTVLFLSMKYIHAENKKIPKPTPQEKEIERVFNICEEYNLKCGGLLLYSKNPEKLEQISNNLNFLMDRYHGQKKKEYLEKMENFEKNKRDIKNSLNSITASYFISGLD